MKQLENKHILLGISGGIAAYKSLELVRLLKEKGATVRPMVTKSALGFVGLIPLEALSGLKVLTDDDPLMDGKITHVEEAYKADLLVFVPTTCNLMAKMAVGLADDILLKTYLSAPAPTLIAPTMETNMWMHPATQNNVRILQERGVNFVGPCDGPLASGRHGVGRMAEVHDILEHVEVLLSKKDYAGKHVLVTAGPTIEDIDPVRFISNQSSGKMGVALARALAMRGAQVELVHGPLKIPVPKTPGITCHAIRSAYQMLDSVISLSSQMDIAIFCAAVADIKPKNRATQKLSKYSNDLTRLDFESTPDILEHVGKLPKRPLMVGFAAESQNLIEKAVDKCTRKQCDFICANDISQTDIGFGSNHNAITMVDKVGIVKEFPRSTKDEIANLILDYLPR